MYHINYRAYIPHLCIIFFLFLVFPAHFYRPVAAGLDPSYIIAIHLAYKYHLIFGQDVVFTFGPLAFLNNRYPIAIHPLIYLLFDIYFLTTILILLKEVIGRQASVTRVLFILIGLLLAINEPLFQGYFIFFLLFLFSFIKQPDKAIYAVQAALLSILCFYYKVNLGLTAIVLFLLSLHYVLVRKKLTPQRYAVLLGSYILCIWLLARLLNVNLHGYITGSLHLIDAYNDAMSLYEGGNAIFLIAALFILFLAFTRLVILIRTSIRKKAFWPNADELVIHAIICFALFVLYKSGFVRADKYHISHFFNIVSLPAAAIYLYCPPDLKKNTAAICCWIILGVATLAANTIPDLEKPFSLQRQLRQLQVDKFSTYCQEIRSFRQTATTPEDTADNELKRTVGNGSLDVIPTEISKVWFSGLRYDPRPVIQSYSAYDSYLDDLNYKKCMSAEAPDYILFSLKSIDLRYPFADESRTKLAMLAHYKLAGAMGDDLLLKKKDLASLVRSKETPLVNARLGEDIPIPRNTDLQYSRIFVHYTWWGWLQRFIYQPPALTITLFPEEGESYTYQALPTMLEDGMLLNRYIGTVQDFQLLMQSGGRLNVPIKKIRIDEVRGSSGFEPTIEIEDSWYSFPPRPAPERTADSMGMAKLTREWEQYKPTLTDSRLYQQDSFRCQIENRATYSPLIRIQGWAFREKTDNLSIVAKAVLQAGDTMYMLPSVPQQRRDLVSYFHREDIVGSGFQAQVSKSQLPPAVYKVGVALEDTISHKKWIWYTHQEYINK